MRDETSIKEDDYLPISALQHLLFCPRQCALIHVEGLWQENRLTVEGRQMHEKVHEQDAMTSCGIRRETGLRICSHRLGLYGVADVVEFHRTADDTGMSESWIPYPVEYKHGKPKTDMSDQVQLCAQALCLEEMLGVIILKGAFFYGSIRRRSEVVFDEQLRSYTVDAAARLHAVVEQGIIPPAEYQSKCRNCSLSDACMPSVFKHRRKAAEYIAAAIQEVTDK